MQRIRISAPAIEALLIAIVTVVLLSWKLTINGWSNEYYAAAARSMSTNWHRFWFVSFDSAGVESVDKPPLTLWLQALSIRAFGYSSASLLAPSVAAGTATTLLVWDTARRAWGASASRVAAAVLLATPIFVAMSRHANPEAVLMLCCAGAVWSVTRAAQSPRGAVWWALAGGTWCGLAILTKSAAGVLVVPGVLVAWLVCAPVSVRRRLAGLCAATVAALVVGFGWAVSVALTNPDGRPWVAGTSNNSIWSLIVGYNGTGRLSGQSGGPMGGGMGGIFGGAPGLLRLLNDTLGPQVGWALGAALAGGAFALVSWGRLRDVRAAAALAAGGWLVVAGGAFSVAAGIFHPYYVALLAPPSALLVGAGVACVRASRSGDSRVVAAVLVCALAATVVLVDVNRGVPRTALVALVVCATGMAGCWFAPLRRVGVVAVVAGAVLLSTAASWSSQTLTHALGGTFPSGGPASTRSITVMPRASGGTHLVSTLEWVRNNGGGTLVVASQSDAAASIIDGATNVAAIGGFSGNETSVSLDWFADRVEAGDIRWVSTSSSDSTPSMGRVGARSIMNAVTSVCTPTSSGAADAPDGVYDCRGHAAQLRTATTAASESADAT